MRVGLAVAASIIASACQVEPTTCDRSDQTAMSAAFKIMNQATYIPVLTTDRSKYAYQTLIPYGNEAEFRRANPACCKIVNDKVMGAYARPDLIARLRRGPVRVVSMTYQARYRDEAGLVRAKSQTRLVSVDRCGRPFREDD
jgi:hypothetical protein